MKVFLASVVAFVVFTFAAWAVLEAVDMSAAHIYSSSHGSVRL